MKIPKTINSDLNTLISCLCPTKNHPSIVINAIMDFKKQSWKNKELVLVTDEKSEYKEILKYFECENIKLFLAPHGSTIGALRNITMDKARGEYVATWDDDDGHHKDRLKIQHESILKSGKKACYLKKVLVHDTITGDKGISKNWRGMEGSMLALKSIVPKYNEAKNITEEIVKIMADASCHFMNVAIESANRKTQILIRRGWQNNEQIAEAVRL